MGKDGFPKKAKENECPAHIIGGSDAYHGEFPYQLGLQLGNRLFCAAFIIDKLYAVTAAHCTGIADVTKLRLVAGDFVLSKNDATEQVRKVVAEIPHEKFNASALENDIALLKVDLPFHFNKYVGPVILPTQGQVTEGCCVVTGWGYITESGPKSDILQKLTVPVVSDDKCRTYYGKNKIADSMICAGYSEGGKDSCRGDSGGPLNNRNYLSNKN
ncbi:Chymotrypsinogen 2 [Armadillidium vulgare]|nr:Chymotrypsinogen 2 [Armadillidium vulgare]